MGMVEIFHDCFYWSCPLCQKVKYERAVATDIDNEDVREVLLDVGILYHLDQEITPGIRAMLDEEFPDGWYIAPDVVYCSACDVEYETEE